MTVAFVTPAVLWLLPLAALPFLSSVHAPQAYPSLAGLERDALSVTIEWILKLAGAVAIAALLFGLGGVHRTGKSIEKRGEGAQIVLLIDRSASMDDTFAGRAPEGGEESKSAAARRLLKSFVLGREHDLVGVAAFSTSPMLILPLTDQKDAVLAAIDAMDRRGLAYTNVARGLALALDMHEADMSRAARVIVLVSDGAAVIDRKVQEKLRAAFAKRRINLYWLYLRTEGSFGIFDAPKPGEVDTPQARPERHLNIFFESLDIPYKAFEAENPQAVAAAVAEIGKLERSPISYYERVPQQDLAGLAYTVGAGAIALLLLGKLAEVRFVKTGEEAS